MKKRTKAQNRLILTAFTALLLLLAMIVAPGLRHNGGVRVGVLKTAQAYGTAMLLQTPSAQYDAVLSADEGALAAALARGELDAAVIPFAAAREIDGGVIRAVLSYENLWCVSAEKLPDITALAGREVTLSERLRGTRGEKMLMELLTSEGVDCELVYGSAGEVFFTDLDGLAGETRAVQFSLGQEWRRIKGNLAPAGLCLVVREGVDASALEKALRDSVIFTGEKTKKACAMAAAAGLAKSEAEADKLIGRVAFVYLTGPDMSAAIHAMDR